MVGDGDLVMKKVRVGLVEIEAFLERRLIVEVQWKPGWVVSSGALEGAAGLDFKHVVAAVAVRVDPFADGVALVGGLDGRGPGASVGVDSTIVVFAADQDIGGIRRDDVFVLS